MSVTLDDLWGHLSGGGATPPPPELADALQRCLDTATAVIAPHLQADVGVWTPEQTQALDLATLRAAQELWTWKDSGGAGEAAWMDGSEALRPVYRDVFHTVQPTLAHAGLIPPTVVA